MGYWGVFVLARTSEPLEEIGEIGRFTDGAMATRTLGPWTVYELTDEAVYNYADEVLGAVQDRTSAPVLIGFVLDSDCLWIAGSVHETEAFRACIGRMATAGYLEDEDARIEDVFLPPAEAMAAMTTWARAAGTTPNAPALRALLELDDVEIGRGADLWPNLLDALGFR